MMQEGLENRELDLRRLERDIGAGLTLPSYMFTSSQVYEAELDSIFYRQWLMICHESELPRIGDVKLFKIGRRSIMMARGSDNQVRAFYNVCRHRGSEILGREGNYKILRCPYRAWTYKLDGSLAGVPDIDDFPELYREDFPLYPVKLEGWRGFLCINLDPKSPPLAGHLGNFEEKFGKYRLEELSVAHDVGDRVVDANWKTIFDNNNECYHCGPVHPETLGPYYREVVPSSESEIQGSYTWLRMQDYGTKRKSAGNNKFDRVRDRDRSLGDRLGLSEEEAEGFQLPTVFPTAALAFTPTWANGLYIIPEGPRRTRLVNRTYYRQDEDSGYIDEMNESMRLVYGQDVAVLEAQQRGLDCEVFTGGRFSLMGEGGIQQFHKLYLAALANGAIQ